MISFFRSITFALVFLTFELLAAPSIELPREWAAPLEGGKGMVLVQTETGQTRVYKIDSDFGIFDSGPVLTHLPDVTGLNTGLDVSGTEEAILSSANTNSVRLLDTDDLSLTTFQPEVPGPVTAIPVRRLFSDPPSLLAFSEYGDFGGVLQRFEDLYLGSPTALGAAITALHIHDLQPSADPDNIERQTAIAAIEIGGEFFLNEGIATATGMAYQEIPAAGGSANEKIAARCLGSDGRQCIIRYQKGATLTNIVTRTYSGFAASTQTSNQLPFAIGSITPVGPGVPDAPHGVLITADDGSRAIYAHILVGKTFEIVATFNATSPNRINGLLPIGGVGLLALEGPAGGSTSTGWTGYQFDGSDWAALNSGALGSWLPAQENFATLFWFNGTPLIDPSAEIIKLETRADWTRKTTPAPIPPQVELSELLAPGQGLTPSSLIAPTPPPGASFLMTSQREDKVSITALASDLAITSPSLSVSPPSGDYQSPVSISALFDSGANELFYREDKPGMAWRPFDTLTIGYPSSWLFYARNMGTGVAGPIIRRDFTFTGINPNSLDSDRDGVPDYVEKHLGLDAAGGADSDGDFQSDLEELLAGTDAADASDNTPPGAPRKPPFLGEGFSLIAQAFSATGQGASPANNFLAGTSDDFAGETLQVFDLHGNLLGEENVQELTTPPALAGLDGAAIEVGTPVPEDAWITLASPVTFNVLDILNPPRFGREILKVAQRPINPIASVSTTPGGVDRDADAIDWISAAQAAHGSHVLVGSITELHPVDNAVSALAEQAIFDSLQSLPPVQKTALGVPSSIEDFTLFPQRRGDSFRTGFSRDMREALLNAGCDFRATLALLKAAALDGDVLDVANDATSTHVLRSDDNALMALPFDAFRSIIRTGMIIDPAPGSPSRLNPYHDLDAGKIALTKTTFDLLLGQVAATKRPVETWSLVIAPSTTPLHEYDYLRQGTGDKVWLMDRQGDREVLEQGLGLPIGAIFEVTGYSDVTGPAGFCALEIIRIESVITPLASDTDSNGNLLDDDWENVFFGDLGVVAPFDPHPLSGHSYLQYFLTGADPRSGSLTTPVVDLLPRNITFVWVPASSSYDMNFTFPAEFADRFDFSVRSSTDLDRYTSPSNVGSLQTISAGNYRFRLKEAESNFPTNFYQIGITLKP